MRMTTMIIKVAYVQVSSLEQELACSSGIMTAFDSVLQMLPDHRLSDLDRCVV